MPPRRTPRPPGGRPSGRAAVRAGIGRLPAITSGSSLCGTSPRRHHQDAYVSTSALRTYAAGLSAAIRRPFGHLRQHGLQQVHRKTGVPGQQPGDARQPGPTGGHELLEPRPRAPRGRLLAIAPRSASSAPRMVNAPPLTSGCPPPRTAPVPSPGYAPSHARPPPLHRPDRHDCHDRRSPAYQTRYTIRVRRLPEGAVRREASVAQGIEHRSPKAGVGSSNLPWGTTSDRRIRPGPRWSGASVCRMTSTSDINGGGHPRSTRLLSSRSMWLIASR
jgi:hypothetical protein